MSRPSFYIGIDTHKYIHTACIIDNDNENKKPLTFTFKNQPRYFDEALERIKRKTKEGTIIFGLEDTQSFGFLFSNYLTEKGYEVKQVNPAQASVYRTNLPNYHKSDEFDSYCVAKVLREDYKRLQSFQHEIVYANIRLLISQCTQLVKQRINSYNTLHQYLSKVYPGYSDLFCNLQTKSALAFYKRFPSSKHLKGYDAKMLCKEMKKCTRMFTKKKAGKILDIIKHNPTPYNDDLIDNLIIEVVDDIYDKEDKLTVLEKRLEEQIQQTGYKLTSIPGVGVAIAGEIISEIGDIKRFKNESQLARYAGIAPVSIGSAGKNKEKHSRGGNRTLRSTMYSLAVSMTSTTIHQEAKQPYFRDYFLKKVSEGKTKPQALICIMRQLTRIVYSMMKNKSEWIQPEYKPKYEIEVKEKSNSK